MACKKGSDAERKGLAVGDRVLAWNRFEPTRSNLWQIYYVYRHIRPQQLQRVIVRKPDGTEKVLDIESAGAGAAGRQPRGADSRGPTTRSGRRSHYQKPIGDTLVVALSSFGDPERDRGVHEEGARLQEPRAGPSRERRRLRRRDRDARVLVHSIATSGSASRRPAKARSPRWRKGARTPSRGRSSC